MAYPGSSYAAAYRAPDNYAGTGYASSSSSYDKPSSSYPNPMQQHQYPPQQKQLYVNDSMLVSVKFCVSLCTNLRA